MRVGSWRRAAAPTGPQVRRAASEKRTTSPRTTQVLAWRKNVLVSVRFMGIMMVNLSASDAWESELHDTHSLLSGKAQPQLEGYGGCIGHGRRRWPRTAYRRVLQQGRSRPLVTRSRHEGRLAPSEIRRPTPSSGGRKGGRWKAGDGLGDPQLAGRGVELDTGDRR